MQEISRRDKQYLLWRNEVGRCQHKVHGDRNTYRNTIHIGTQVTIGTHYL